MPASANDRLAAARAAVNRACQLLESPTPERLDRSTSFLETAISELVAYTRPAPAIVSGPERAAIREQALFLKSSIRHARRLSEAAAAFHANWFRCLRALCGGYTPQGQPAALNPHGRLLARG